jgi:hypothetical protein
MIKVLSLTSRGLLKKLKLGFANYFLYFLDGSTLTLRPVLLGLKSLTHFVHPIFYVRRSDRSSELLIMLFVQLESIFSETQIILITEKDGSRELFSLASSKICFFFYFNTKSVFILATRMKIPSSVLHAWATGDFIMAEPDRQANSSSMFATSSKSAKRKKSPSSGSDFEVSDEVLSHLSSHH